MAYSRKAGFAPGDLPPDTEMNGRLAERPDHRQNSRFTTTIRMIVPTIDTSSEPRQPSRLEKKANTMTSERWNAATARTSTP